MLMSAPKVFSASLRDARWAGFGAPKRDSPGTKVVGKEPKRHRQKSMQSVTFARGVAQLGRALGSGPRGSQVQILSPRCSREPLHGKGFSLERVTGRYSP